MTEHQSLPPTPAMVRHLDAITEWTGRCCAWLTLVMVLTTVAVVLLRRFLGLGATGLQEAVIYMHAAVFLLGAGYALKHGEQVRVDIFYRRFSPRTRAWVDALGTLVFLLPMCVFVAAICWSFVLNSWHIGEVSTDAGGLPTVYLLKSLMLLFALSLGLAALAELGRAIAVLVWGERS
ncbi:TRAP transporter small permease subunit [Gilvimarinus xylanilyticus]|uniref:TRAP transporter small permease protein n=1 Tax=Gilvimarinus xylanilyticus TaxID=2944139 RepID=A0A9X2I2Q6_9GAMM|nr:TRAP transporter small permease subunit [Gilvimarinus xylanilyticus]MCP8899738.1 TRAP transporter small permease subunit [Gilvimarinus xylanilyticus]